MRGQDRGATRAAGRPGAAAAGDPAASAPRSRKIAVSGLSVAKTGNLQPYLFKVLQEQDAGAVLDLAILVRSNGAGISAEALNARIVEAFDQLGISVEWEPA